MLNYETEPIHAETLKDAPHMKTFSTGIQLT